GGAYLPGNHQLNDDLTFGARFDVRSWAQLGWTLQTGGVDLNEANQVPIQGVITSVNGYFVDADRVWYVRRSDLGAFAGVGLAHVDLAFRGEPGQSENTLTINGGVHYAWNLPQNLLVKPEFRLRKWEGHRYQKTDEEYTASVGWHF